MAHTLEQEVQDALAVLDAAESQRAALCTHMLGGLTGARLAAEHPDRVGALVMYASVVRTLWAPDYDWALTREEREELIEQTVAAWGGGGDISAGMLGPSAAEDAAVADWFSRLQRLAASPAEARIMSKAMLDVDVRDVLPDISVPTLVMHRGGDPVMDVRHSRYIAGRVPGARYVEFDGADSLPFLGDSEAVLEEMKEFLTGERSSEPTRALLTVMFTDIVDSTVHAAALGDARWRDLLARHDKILRKELARFGGREVKHVGDGLLATFDGPPSRALRCALAIADEAGSLAVGVRVGMHMGECELIGDDVAGMAVHIAARVNALAGPGEVLVSGTVFGTVVGGPFSFESRGSHALKGVPGNWPLFALGD